VAWTQIDSGITIVNFAMALDLDLLVTCHYSRESASF